MQEPAHILVVDDDPDIRRLLQLLLHNAGYRVSLLGSGEEALAFLQLVTPDLILLDLTLPGVDGQEVAARVKDDAARPFMPIIIITARADLESKITGLDAGADDFLVKPVDFGELLARVRAMLRLQRSQRSLQAEKRKTELLLDLTRELGSTLDLNALLTRFLAHLSDVVGASRGSIILAGEGRPQFYSTSRKPMLLPLDRLLSNGVSGWVLRQREALVIADTRSDTRWIGDDPYHRSIHSVAAAPILNERDVLGVITLVHHTPNYFNREHMDLLGSVAAQSATALEKAQLFRLVQEQNDLLEQRAEQLMRLNQVGRSLSELMQPDQLLRLASHFVRHAFGYESASILLTEGDELVLRACSAPPREEGPTRVPLGAGPIGRAATTQRATHAERPEVAGGDALLAVPISVGRDVLGVLVVRRRQGGAFSVNDEALLGALALQIGVALANARLYRQVESERSTLNAVLRSAADPILLIGPHNDLLLANPAAETRLLHTPSAVGRPIAELLPQPELLSLLTDDHERGTDHPGEVVLGDGTTLSTSVAPVLTADGQLLGRVATFQDISAIKELERQRFERVQTVLRRYVSPGVVDELLRRGSDTFGTPEERDVAVLVADLRGYTELGESLAPGVLVEQVLNRYFQAMTEALYSYDGTIDKFLGDGIIAAFGTPLARPDDPQRALEAAVAMQCAFGHLRAAWNAELGIDVGMGVGLSYGHAVVGNIGSDQHLDYTLIGDVVNTASRLSSAAGPGQIIVSHHLVAQLPPTWPPPWQLLPLDPLQLKGKANLHEVFRVDYQWTLAE